jgi:hypothetical protein
VSRSPEKVVAEHSRVLAPGEGDKGDGPRPVARLVHVARARAAGMRCTLAALAAWAITVAPLAASARPSALTRIAALSAVVPGVVGAQLAGRRHRLARHVGISAFLVLSVLTWALASRDQVLVTVDRFRALLGALAWGVFAVAWSHPWSVPDVLLKDAPEGASRGLKPRRRLPAYSLGAAALGVAAAAGCLVLGWSTEDPDRAVFAQALATGAAVALITAGSTVALSAGRGGGDGDAKPRLPIDRRVIRMLLLMLLAAGAALALYLGRR